MNKSPFLSIDWGLFVPVCILVLFSLATLFSLSPQLFRSQLIFFCISLVAFFFFSQSDVRILRMYSLQIYIVSVVLLLIILFLGIESRGAVRWIELFGFRIQFSEIIKPFLAIAVASFLAERLPSFKTLFLSVLLLFPILFLVFRQPDLGNALIFMYTAALLFFLYGFPWVWFLLGAVVSAGMVPIMWHFLHEYQRQRLITFLNPSQDPLGISYNAVQSVIAVGSGMWFGRGIGESTQAGLRFLPERHTDFIFATIAEKFGFFASVFIVFLFGYLLYRILRIYYLSGDVFSKLFAACCFFFLLVQLFINIGMNIGLVPITGVTLPFVSYGGSSLLSNFILLGLLSSLARNLARKSALEIR